MISADYVRVFLTIIEKGSFSAASDALHRSQTAISYSIRNLEDQLGVTLFDRSGRRPVLTPAGTALISEAQAIVHGIDNLRARASAIASGTETELTIAVDCFFPVADLAEPLRELATLFPETLVTLRTFGVGKALAGVIDGSAMLGIVSLATSNTQDFQQIPLPSPPIRVRPVVAADHPLAQHAGELTVQQLGIHIQLMTELNLSYAIGGASRRIWYCTDLAMQRELLIAGIGWGALPDHIVAADITAGRLKELDIISWSESSWSDLAMGVIHRSDASLGPASRWLVSRLSRSGLVMK